MPNIPSFSEDMLPRHFPKTREQQQQNSAVVPMPVLPGLSLILDDENKVFEAEPVSKAEPKQTFQEWKQQYGSMFTDNCIERKLKSDKKQVRFETDDHEDEVFSQRKCVANKRISPPDSPNLEFSYYEAPLSQGCKNNHCHQQEYASYHDSQKSLQSANANKSVLLTGFNSQAPSKSTYTDNVSNGFRKPTYLPNFNQNGGTGIVTHNSTSAFTLNNNQPEKQNRTCLQHHCCQINQNYCEVTDQPPTHPKFCPHDKQIGYVNGQMNQHQIRRQQLLTDTPFSVDVERKPKIEWSDDNLLRILDDQQQHILLQQNQILMQQKQNLEQQNQIFRLQRQVQQLLQLTNENDSPNKQGPSTICENLVTSPSVTSQTIKTRNDPAQPCNGTTNRSSIGVMTSFLGTSNDVPNTIQKIKTANDKFIENLEEYSYKDSMLDRINDAIRNSPTMIDYRTKYATTNDCAAPNQQPDINIAAQTLIYETSISNNGYVNEPKSTDRSLALYMLGMKYNCSQDNVLPNTVEQGLKHSPLTVKSNDHVSVNISPDAYNYLKRHGLLKQ